MYGITETTVHVTQRRLSDEQILVPPRESPIGIPLPETTVYVCDRHLNPQPFGVPGEMLVGGDQNRTMNVTVLCPPQVRTVVPVSCVEAGRWGKRRVVSTLSKHAPGSLRAAKTAKLEPRSDDVSSRRSDQGRIWDEVERQSMAHDVFSDTSALDDVQEEIADRLAPELEKIRMVPGQIGVICTIGEQDAQLAAFEITAWIAQDAQGCGFGQVVAGGNRGGRRRGHLFQAQVLCDCLR